MPAVAKPAPALADGRQPRIGSGFLDHLARAKPSTDPGIDISHRGGTPKGTPAMAPAPGVVKRALQTRTKGGLVEIDHGNGFLTRQLHLEGIKVVPGQFVAAGQQIADIGVAGGVRHIHFTAFLNGVRLDPGPLFELARVTAVGVSPADTPVAALLQALRTGQAIAARARPARAPSRGGIFDPGPFGVPLAAWGLLIYLVLSRD